MADCWWLNVSGFIVTRCCAILGLFCYKYDCRICILFSEGSSDSVYWLYFHIYIRFYFHIYIGCFDFDLIGFIRNMYSIYFLGRFLQKEMDERASFKQSCYFYICLHYASKVLNIPSYFGIKPTSIWMYSLVLIRTPNFDVYYTEYSLCWIAEIKQRQYFCCCANDITCYWTCDLFVNTQFFNCRTPVLTSHKPSSPVTALIQGLSWVEFAQIDKAWYLTLKLALACWQILTNV